MSLKNFARVGAFVAVLWVPTAFAAVIYQTGFEAPTYSTGDVDGQDGWQTDVGPTDRVQVRNDVPREGGQSLWSASGGGVFNTRAIRALSLDASGQIVNLESRIAFTTGNRSDWEFSSVFGTGGFMGGLRVLGNNEFVLETAFGSFASGVFTGGFQTIGLGFNFVTGIASATRNGVEIASGAFDATNTMITNVAAVRQIIPRADAIALDRFSVSAVTAVPEPSSASLLGLALVAGLATCRRRILG